VARSRKTRPVTKADAAAYFAKSTQFMETMEQALTAGQWDSVGLQAVHAVISASDALVTYRGGVRSAEQDHRVAAHLLQETFGPDAAPAVRHVSHVIAKKNAVAYEQRRLSEKEAREMAEHARRFLAWARERLP